MQVSVPDVDIGEPFNFEGLKRTPNIECDLVMKGGVTSGVVYPRAIISLASKYRLRSIGGSSAGAIAAAFAAAAEYDRQEGGYLRLEHLAQELPSRLPTLFQPKPPLRPIFRSALALLGKKGLPLFGAGLVRACYLLAIHIGKWSLLLGVTFGLFGWLFGHGVVWIIHSLWQVGLSVDSVSGGRLAGAAAGGVAGAVLGALVTLCQRTKRELEAADFGFCPGTSEDGQAENRPGLSEWLHRRINTVAGLKETDPPLTFRQLRERGVDLAVTTTNLSELRQYRLPFTNGAFYFLQSEMKKVFPSTVWQTLFPPHGSVLAAEQAAAITRDGKYARYTQPDDMPVVVAVRLSLSFPLLLSTVSLYAKECVEQQSTTSNAQRSQGESFHRHVFSDGGITSNIPIHFFDAPLPRRPTFAINLENFDETRHLAAVSLPSRAEQFPSRRVGDMTTLGKFASAILDTLQEWSDNSRLEQPGTRERVVTVRLAKSEGGLNLVMGPDAVRNLMNRGQAASWLLRRDFDFDRHRRWRYLVWSKALEDALYRARAAFVERDQVESQLTFKQVLDCLTEKGFPASEFKPPTDQWLGGVNQRTAELMELLERQGAPSKERSLPAFADAPLPQPEPGIALVAKS
jgi:predicted acylesterase/phospholipase RssA